MRNLIRICLFALVAVGQSGAKAHAQDWSFLSNLVQQTLDVQAGDSPPTLFSDHPDPAVARFSLIFHYVPNRFGGNSVGLNVGLFRRDPVGWRFLTQLQVYGYNPREARFAPGQITITTTMQGPNDPRCCPTVPTVWTINTETYQVFSRP